MLGLAAFSAIAAGATTAGPPAKKGSDLQRAGLSQAGRSLVATFRTARPVPLAQVEPLPSPRAREARYLCLELRRATGAGRRLCVGGDRAHRRVGLELTDGQGRAIRKRMVPGRVKRAGPRKLVVTLIPADAGLSPGHYEWRAVESRGRCGRSRDCVEARPTHRWSRFRLRPVRAVGCTGGAPVLDTHGPRDRPVVALTFDDGPGEYTPAYLDVLREKHVSATFFEIGQEMPGREDTMRRILSEGHELGNHTMHHTFYPGYSEMAEASAAIESATHFRPCLFRPPGGGVDSAVIGNAAALGMRTVTWDVDPSDWQNPGSGAVYSRVVEATQAGSIVLMHDGGVHTGTLAALPSIIDTLRARGFRFATVSELLGKRLIYRPYG